MAASLTFGPILSEQGVVLCTAHQYEGETFVIVTSARKHAPFLKWPGGKRLLAQQIISQFPQQFSRYIEPFLGGGAIFFSLLPHSAHLSDIDGELINAYRQIRDDVEEVIRVLGAMSISRDEFYRLRHLTCLDPLQKAVRFLYLNRTAFNGIYRVNRRGQFNVPFGCKPGTRLCDPDLLRSAAEALAVAKIEEADFALSIAAAGPGDLVYADPPYTTKHDDNGFRRYNRHLFSWEDQIRLADSVRKAVARGSIVIVSNAHHKDLRHLYCDFSPVVLDRVSCISGSPQARGSVKEYLFVGGSL